jgi:hypothetical protein
MEVIPFLEYLHERPTSRELAESLVQVFQLRRRAELIPAGMDQHTPRRVAS